MTVYTSTSKETPILGETYFSLQDNDVDTVVLKGKLIDYRVLPDRSKLYLLANNDPVFRFSSILITDTEEEILHKGKNAMEEAMDAITHKYRHITEGLLNLTIKGMTK